MHTKKNREINKEPVAKEVKDVLENAELTEKQRLFFIMGGETQMGMNGVEVYENDIVLHLKRYIEERNIEDMHKEPQSRWNAALLYINKALFKGTDVLKADNYTTGNLRHNNPSNNNAYDTDKVNRVCDIYIDLCYEYDKEVSLMGFSKLTGIALDTLYQWAAENTQPGSSGSEIYKKLNAEREESLSNKLVTGKQNPVGLLGVLNRHYGWNMGQPRGQQEAKTQSIEQIQERYRAPELPDNSKTILPPEADF